MPLGSVLYESGDVLRHIYFPTDCIVSLLYVMKDGASAEIAVVGNEGAVFVSGADDFSLRDSGAGPEHGTRAAPVIAAGFVVHLRRAGCQEANAS